MSTRRRGSTRRTGKTIPWRRVALSYACETCGAPPGDDCVTESDAYTLTPHVFRTRLAAADHWRDHDDDDESESDPP